jgi:hypothetical protein
MRITKCSSFCSAVRITNPQGIVQDVKNIKEIRNLPKIEPITSLKSLRNPFADENKDEEEQVNQDGDKATFSKEGITMAMEMR